MTDATTQPGLHRSGFANMIAAWWGERPLTQLGLFAALVVMFGVMGSNTLESLHRLGLTPGFAFLTRAADFDIGESLISYQAGDSYGRALLVGLLNTIEVSVCGCILATILGVALGIARLSGNLLLSGLVQAYVEIVRNTPLLLQLFFWSATTHALPGPREAINPFGSVFLTNRGVFIPAIEASGPAPWIGLGALALLLGSAMLLRRRQAHPFSLAQTTTVLALAILVIAVTIVAAGSDALHFNNPALKGYNIRGGLSRSPEFAALLVGLVVNSAASISEIVRSGIQSVAHGQTEAARALGLSRGRIMRLVVLPQAMRVITPLMTSSYLDLTKNSSLAVAIGFPDLVSVVNTSANHSGQPVETILVLVVAYLALNLTVSAVMNRYNRRLVDRGIVAR